MRNIHELYKVEFNDGFKGALGIDERGQLYWNGDPVRTELQVRPPWWAGLGLFVAGLSLFAIAATVVWFYFGAVFE